MTDDTQDAKTEPFDPRKHLSLISGNEYLEVKWRIKWFRSEHPDGVIKTELIAHKDGVAVVKAEVRTAPEVIADSGTGEIRTVFSGGATGHGMEDSQSFGDYLEKAETKAVGRALAALGYGTQFTQEFEFGPDTGRVVDAPVRSPQGYDQGPQRQGSGGRTTLLITAPQRGLIVNLAKDLLMSDEDLDQYSHDQHGKPVDELLRREASAMIDDLQERKRKMG